MNSKSIPDLKPSTDNKTVNREARRRGLVVVAFSLMPLLIPTVMYASLRVFSDIEEQRSLGTVTEYGGIHYPEKGKPVPSSYTAVGTLKKVPKGYHAYVSLGSDDLHWPKIEIKEGNWALDMTVSGESGYKYNLAIIAVNLEGKIRIDEWFKNGEDTGKYPPLTDVADMRTLATVRVSK